MPAAKGAPLLLLPSTGTALKGPYLTTLMRAVLQSFCSPMAHQVTVHSLRRTGAHLATAAGAPEKAVMELGKWSSAAIRRYLPTPISSAAPTALAAVFGSYAAMCILPCFTSFISF